MPQRAFTLAELLIVIAIIMILLGLLFPALRMVQAQALKTKAASDLAQIKGACELYKNINGAYPDSANIAGVFSSGTSPNITITPWSQLTATNWVTVDAELVARLQMVDRDHFLPNTTLGAMRDPWKQLYRYRPPQYYPYLASGQSGNAVPPIDSQTPPNQDTCQLWSTGPNMVDEAGENGSPAVGLTTTQIPDDIYLKN